MKVQTKEYITSLKEQLHPQYNNPAEVAHFLLWLIKWWIWSPITKSWKQLKWPCLFWDSRMKDLRNWSVIMCFGKLAPERLGCLKRSSGWGETCVRRWIPTTEEKSIQAGSWWLGQTMINSALTASWKISNNCSGRKCYCRFLSYF